MPTAPLPPAPLPPRVTLRRFKHQAKDLLTRLKTGHSDTLQWFKRVLPDDDPQAAKLADAQRMIARVYGFPSWAKLKQHLASKPAEERVIDAAASGDTELLAELLDADPGLLHATGGWERMRPLYFAMRHGDHETIGLLRSRGATLDIFEAARLGHVQELARLLDADPAAARARRDHYDATPLHCVRDAGLAAARLLIDRGAEVNAIDSDAQRLTPLHGRAEHGDAPMAALLLEYGADVHAMSCMGAPLHCAVGGFQHRPPERWRDVADLLLGHGADVNADMAAFDKPGWTPLHHAAWRDHPDAAKWLLDHGADPSIVNQHGHTPLETALHFKHEAVATHIQAASNAEQ